MPAQHLISAMTLYLEVGLVFALAFVLLVGVIEPAARGAYAFRPLLLPAATLLWPVVLARSVRALIERRGNAS